MAIILAITLKVLETSDDSSNIKSVLLEIILQTTQLAEASKELRQQLEASQKEMEELRNELEVVRETANTDKLTGLLNRWGFDKVLGRAYKNRHPWKCLPSDF